MSATLAAAAILCVAGGRAAAQNLDLEEVGAALALPLITGFNRSTEISITNAGAATRLHINVLSADPFTQWASQDFDCDVTRNETTLFVFRSAGDFQESSLLTYECLDENGDSKVFRDVPFNAMEGIVFVSIQDPATGETINTNQIFGDATVIDYGAGNAWSVGAIPFQGRSVTPGVADRKYRFDNVEYAAFPSKLATNFIAPTATPSSGVIGTLVLFTLDGTVGAELVPDAHLSIKFYNDDEMVFSTSHFFDCFDIISLEVIDPRFNAASLGSDAGHMVLTPQVVTYPNLAHDSLFDPVPANIIGVRKTPVHGWLFQGDFGFDDPVPGVTRPDRAWARALSQSQTALVPSPGDTPALFAP